MPNEKAILAGGCFWGMQELFRHQPGVVSTRVGYSGGDVPNATYRNHGTHAESIEVVYDPEKTDFRALLEFFFQVHDPSTKNRQGDDIGRTALPAPPGPLHGGPDHFRGSRRGGDQVTGVRPDPDAQQVQAVRMPTGADRRIGRGGPVRVRPARLGQSLELHGRERHESGVQLMDQRRRARAVLRVVVVVEPAAVVQQRCSRGSGPAPTRESSATPAWTLEEARAELSALGARAAADFLATHRHLRPQVVKYAELFIGGEGCGMTYVVQFLFVVLQLILASNVATVVFARTASREGEIGMRFALGASRARILAQLFAETFVLALYGTISYQVSRRAPEIGVRMALGATRQRVVGSVLRATMMPVGVGLSWAGRDVSARPPRHEPSLQSGAWCSRRAIDCGARDPRLGPAGSILTREASRTHRPDDEPEKQLTSGAARKRSHKVHP